MINNGMITGGGGGYGGSSDYSDGSGGDGGAGIVGKNFSIDNRGATISGGMSGGAAPVRANAIEFTGGANTLTLDGGSTVTGGVLNKVSLTVDQPGGSLTYDGTIAG